MHSIREKYEELGVDRFYKEEGHLYKNPHEYMITRALANAIPFHSLNISNVLDLACGSGEASSIIISLNGHVHGIDPYTQIAYKKRIGQNAELLSFDDIIKGAICNRRYSLVICSYALHLIEVSKLPLLCYRLEEISDTLLILTPHKRPEIKQSYGWKLIQEKTYNAHKIVYHRTRLRLYKRVNNDI